MSRSVFEAVGRAGGWGLLNNGNAVLWFPERDKALEITNISHDPRS